MSVDKFNSEGYYDPTAYEAMSTVEKEERALRAFRPIVYICSPYAGEIEKNVKAMLSQGFAKLDLVTREEFDVQQEVLARTREQLAALETRLTELEATLAFKDAPADSTPATPPAGSDTQP